MGFVVAFFIFLASIGVSKVGELHRLRKPYTLDYKDEQQCYETAATILKVFAAFMLIKSFNLCC